MSTVSIFIDAGHYNSIQKCYGLNFDFTLFASEVLQTLERELVQPVGLSHIFYYDCLPYVNSGSSEGREALDRRQSYFKFLRAQPGVQVREGLLVRRTLPDGHFVLVQKRMDLLLGLDVAEECSKRRVSLVALIAGDGDFVPVVEFASHNSVQVWLFHSPRGSESGCSNALWTAADGRVEIDEQFALKVSRGAYYTPPYLDTPLESKTTLPECETTQEVQKPVEFDSSA